MRYLVWAWGSSQVAVLTRDPEQLHIREESPGQSSQLGGTRVESFSERITQSRSQSGDLDGAWISGFYSQLGSIASHSLGRRWSWEQESGYFGQSQVAYHTRGRRSTGTFGLQLCSEQEE